MRRKQKRKKRIRLILCLIVLFFALRGVISLSGIGQVIDGRSVPCYYQWDKRWADQIYGDGPMEKTGCGPTCLSMVYTGLTGNKDYNPYELAMLAQEKGYYVDGAGSAWSMMDELAKTLGLKVKKIAFNENSIRKNLKKGHPIICIMGPGDFTKKGHFIVLSGMDGDGNILVNDPNSRKNTNQRWKLDVIMSQSRDLWAYYY